MKKQSLPNNFEFTSCDNTICIDHKTCKRYVMFSEYGATDVKTGGGTSTKHCKRYLPLAQ